jgi:hypothetical protein
MAQLSTGTRVTETDVTEAPLGLFVFHPVDRVIAELAGAFGRQHLASLRVSDHRHSPAGWQLNVADSVLPN